MSGFEAVTTFSPALASKRSLTCSRTTENVSRIKFVKSAMSSQDSTLRYSVQIGWSDADHAFIAAVPELPGCLADGTTYEEALKAIEDEIGIWLETARLEGWRIPEPKIFKSAEAVASAS